MALSWTEIALRPRLAAVSFAEPTWRNAHVAPKYAGEMAVVGKSTFQRHLGDRALRCDESSTRVLDPQPPHILAERLAVRPPEAARQMNWMHPSGFRGLGKGHRCSIARMHQRKDRLHPWIARRIFASLFRKEKLG